MIRTISTIRTVWFILAVLALISALIGLINPNIYTPVVSDEVSTGILSQDIITAVFSIIALLLLIKIRKEDTIKQIILVGIAGYLFYGYGIYVIEQIYTMLYFAYMTIFALSAYSIIYYILIISQEITRKIQLSKNVRIISIIFLLISPILFIPLWASQILSLIQSSQKLEFTYSIYILDLCFIMPAFIITAILVGKKNHYGLLFSPSLFIWSFALLCSVALGGIIRVFQSQSVDKGEIMMYLILSALYLLITYGYFRKIKIDYQKT